MERYFNDQPCKHGHVSEWYICGATNRGCLECKRIRGREWNKTNVDKVRAYDALPERRARTFRERYPERWRKMCNAAVQRYFRNNIQRRLASKIRSRVRRFACNGRKAGSVTECLGCSFEFLVGYIEAKFEPGWTWENLGTFWELDHVRPLSSFNLNDPEQFRIACHYNNLQPLSVAAHRSKTNGEQRLRARLVVK